MFDRAAVEARLETATDNPCSEFDEHYICKCLAADLRATLAALDAATAERDAAVRLLTPLQERAEAAAASDANATAREPQYLAAIAELRQERDAATARVAALEAQVRADHRATHGAIGTAGVCATCIHAEGGVWVSDVHPCAILRTLALAPAPGEENG